MVEAGARRSWQPEKQPSCKQASNRGRAGCLKGLARVREASILCLTYLRSVFDAGRRLYGKPCHVEETEAQFENSLYKCKSKTVC